MEKKYIIALVDELINVFKKAGQLSIELRNKGLIKKTKSDNTPVTNGDIEVNNILVNEIKRLTPKYPIVSEEKLENKFEKNLKNFWLIDPIDGTYDYVNNKDEFTLNAALIVDKAPFLGIVYAPSKKRLFYTYGDKKSFEINEKGLVELKCKKITKKDEVVALTYSNNIKSEILEIHKKNNVTSFVKMKSSLKFCVIAAGEFDLYVAEPRACEWDIAAGHAILKNAGGIITDFEGNEILYGKKDFINPSIVLKRSQNLK